MMNDDPVSDDDEQSMECSTVGKSRDTRCTRCAQAHSGQLTEPCVNYGEHEILRMKLISTKL
jgi:hypothetical protein